ncbi:pickpocket protein 28-like [Leguminivora glycinivorella]|uniref:pickpocket protein 28-like n=1 Tax=Leguminivora glycinivorella TaxID=1035111 RepID=UPI00200CD267|nr:pickpocket protein 28-like [Leguminivora glycinivorella]XP_048007455.1 pickpocket protein 28-like [Leguminivora glycinivorella]
MPQITKENSMEPERRKIGSGLCHNFLVQIFHDFAENTTLNGLKYIAGKGFSFLERLFWFSTFVLSTALCVFMVYRSYVKYDTSGVAVTLKERLVPVNEYPFPAVTICPQPRISQKRYNYTRELLNFRLNSEDNSTADLKKLHSTMVFCDNGDEDTSDMLLNYTIDINTFYEVVPKREDIFEECWWRNEIDCIKKFRPVLTADGICYTFNTLATNDIFRKKSLHQKRYYLNSSTAQKGWTLEKNYNTSSSDVFPRRGRANGAYEDLFISLKEVTDRDFTCDRHTRPGYMVYFHHPADMPQGALHNYVAQPGKTTAFAIKLDILDTADELANYSPDIRQCYFPNERYLQFFQKYTSLNCQLECLTNYTVKICGCVSFYMPRNSSTPVCNADMMLCLEKAVDQYATEEDLHEGKPDQCDCLPSCKDLNYDADIVITKLDLKEYYKKVKEFDKLEIASDDYDDYDDDEDSEDDTYETSTEVETETVTSDDETSVEADDNNTSVDDETETDIQFTEIQIYYRRPRFVAMQRSELVGLSQFLADVGGTLGLFLGFSFLTLAEIFYYFSIKLFCAPKREDSKKEETSNPPKESYIYDSSNL